MIRIDHINIVVSDMERSVRFYAELLGLRRGFETTLEGEWVERVTGLPGARAHCVFMETDDPTVRLELLQYLSPTGEGLAANRIPNTPGLRHLAFNLDDEATLNAVLGRLRDARVDVVSDPVVVPFRVANLGRKRLCYFYDPDGTVLELAAYGAD
jgi:catechol 2,3-dioxygenase-like lactoylglutathione lyase family enzyme